MRYEASKRAIDVGVSLTILLVLLPIWLAIAAVIKATSRGPVFFRADAIGQHGKPFKLLKYRTMRHASSDASHKEAIRRFMAGQSLDGAKAGEGRREIYKIAADPRITPFGRLLRKTGLDEVPQFLNVLKGEMSVVGPRPPAAYEYAAYRAEHRRRLDVPVGITGLYQITARSMVPFETMIAIDLDYISKRSLWFDLSIMTRTPWVMLTGRGAY